MAIVRTHRPVWSAERCLPCGACTRRCPVSVFPEQAAEPDSLRGRVARAVAFPDPSGQPAVPPCQAACPLGQDVPAYCAAIARGELDAALAVVRQTNPLPAICGRICTRACMRACVRAALEAPVPIRALKRAAVELAVRVPFPAPKTRRSERVVVVGAGPAGLAAALGLRRVGFAVEVLEAEAEPGGLLRYAVPAFDLPRAALSRDIEDLLACGVELRCNRRIDSLAELQALRAGGARAVVLAIGAGLGRRLGVPGEARAGCTDVVSFARQWADGVGPTLAGPVVVVGDGTMAVAAARLALRSGAGPVTLVTRRSRADLGADPDRLAEAEEEGVGLLVLHRPVEVLGAERLEAVRCVPLAAGEPDKAGRRWPAPAAGESRRLAAATLVAAVDRESRLDWLEAGALRRGPLGGLWSDGVYRTSLDGVYLAGDALTGARNALEAIATGLRAAAAVAGDLGSGR